MRTIVDKVFTMSRTELEVMTLKFSKAIISMSGSATVVRNNNVNISKMGRLLVKMAIESAVRVLCKEPDTSDITTLMVMIYGKKHYRGMGCDLLDLMIKVKFDIIKTAKQNSVLKYLENADTFHDYSMLSTSMYTSIVRIIYEDLPSEYFNNDWYAQSLQH